MKSLIIQSLLLALLWFTAFAQSAKTGNIDHQEMGGQPVSKDLEPKIMEVNGVDLHYVDKGEGVPVVFVHGSLGDYRTFHYQIKDFSKDYRAISYSQRSYLHHNFPTDSPSDLNMVHVNDLISFIQSINGDPVHLVGHSSGAGIALQTAIQHPELVKTLILGEAAIFELLREDPKGDSIMNEIRTEYNRVKEAYRRDEDEEGTRLFFQFATGDPQFLNILSPIDQKIIKDNVADRKARLLDQNLKHIHIPLQCSDIQKITMPTLIVEGEKSPGWLIYLQEKLEACLNNNEHVRLPNTSHGLNYENPEAFNEAVLQFLEKH